MKTIEVVDAVAPMSEYAQKVRDEPVILTIGGKPVAALMAIENTDMETAILSVHPQFLSIIEAARDRQKSQTGLSAAEMRRRLGLSGGKAEKTIETIG